MTTMNNSGAWDRLRAVPRSLREQAMRMVRIVNVEPGGKPPFPPLRRPPVARAQVGSLAMHNAHDDLLPPYLWGYFTAHHPTRDYLPLWLMERDGMTWMSLTPKELESCAPSLALAQGDVLIMGLGLGALAYSVRRKPGVRSVTVIDNDPEVIRINAMVGSTEGCTVICADALDWRPAARQHFDTALIDIWHTFDDLAIPQDMRTIHAHVGADCYGVWSVELTFAQWVAMQYRDGGLERQPRPGSLFERFAHEALGVPLFHTGAAQLQGRTYEQWCIQAAVNSIAEGQYLNAIAKAVGTLAFLFAPEQGSAQAMAER